VGICTRSRTWRSPRRSPPNSGRPLPRNLSTASGWVPGGEDFAYATYEAVFMVSPGGERRTLGPAPERGWPPGSWLGFSPDGRYIGLGEFPVVAVFEVETGEVRVLYREPADGSEFISSTRAWWREEGEGR